MIMFVTLNSCCNTEIDYSTKFKYKIGDIVYHKVSKKEILILDTIRGAEWEGIYSKGDMVYQGVNYLEENVRYYETELSQFK